MCNLGIIMTGVQDLPVEVIMEIFDYLDVIDLCSCSKSTRKFREISLVKRFWSSVRIFPLENPNLILGARYEVPCEFLAFIIQNGCTYLDLAICEWQFNVDTSKLALPRSNLKYLKLSRPQDDLLRVGFHDPNLNLFRALMESCESLAKLALNGKLIKLKFFSSDNFSKFYHS